MKFPKIMAIINTTKDSFSDGGDYYDLDKSLNYAKKIIDNSQADIIDIGGESSRPGAQSIAIEDEIRQTAPLIESIKKYEPNITISIDTVKYQVALQAVNAGATIINDISGLQSDINIGLLAAKSNIAYILMHKKGSPKNMQINPQYDNVVTEVFNFLQKQITLAQNLNIKNIYADFGIGFGKNYSHNIQLLKNIDYFKKLNVPLVLGISRKTFINDMLSINNPKDRDIPTLLIHTLLLNHNIDIIRVHNTQEYKILKKIYQELF